MLVTMTLGPELIPLSEKALAPIARLYDESLYLQAYNLAIRHGSLQTWQGSAARVLAGQLAGQLGASKLRRTLHILAWRQNRAHPESFCHYVYSLWETQGLYAAWNRMEHMPDFPALSSREHGHLLCLWTSIYYSFRDFEQARENIDQALHLCPEDPWVWVIQSRLFSTEDRYDEALDSAEKALSLQPKSRNAIATVAHLLKLQNRAPEAITLLQSNTQELESAELVGMLAQLYLELEQYAIAQQTYEQGLKLSPLAAVSYTHLTLPTIYSV